MAEIGRLYSKQNGDVPPEVLQTVKDTLAQMLAGKFTRFDVFAGPIKDNKGNVVVDKDYDNYDPYLDGMGWLLEGEPALPDAVLR